jgi:cysteine desulfurase NifS
MNTADAAERGILNGDKVLIKTERGQVEMYAFVTDDIVQGAVEASGAGGGALGSDDWKAACVNDLTDLNNHDPISGFPAYKALLCDVRRADNSRVAHIPTSGEYTLDEEVKNELAGNPIYLDNNATTPIDPEVQATMTRFAMCYGNPSSIYSAGRQAHEAIEAARKSLALLINCTPRRLIFTSGGSEGNNFIIKSVALSSSGSRNHIITTAIEHPSVINTCKWLESLGFTVTYLPVGPEGIVGPEDLSKALSEKTCLVSVMAANNETGSIQPIPELARIAGERGILFHTDAVQAVGKIPVDAQAWGVDFLTLSGHKFRAPKGIGAAYIRKGVEVAPLIHGGKQEGGLRGGTENTLGIIAMGRAAQLAGQNLGDMQGRVRTMRDKLYEGLRRIAPAAKLNGHPEKKLPNTLNVTLPGIRGESLVLALDSHGVFFSSGSACKSGSPEPSQALLAMGLSEEDAHCALRFSLGLENTQQQIEKTLQVLEEVIKGSLKNVRFVSCR